MLEETHRSRNLKSCQKLCFTIEQYVDLWFEQILYYSSFLMTYLRNVFLLTCFNFTRHLVMSMQAACLDGLGGEKHVEPSLQETTVIQQMFGGRLKSKVT